MLGHEARAWWWRSAPGVDAVGVGDHVICSIIGPCEHCFQCLRDDHALCEEAPFFTGKMLDGTTRLSQGGTPIHTLHYQGSYAEYAVVPERFVVPVRPTSPLDVVCGLACGGGPPASARRWCARRGAAGLERRGGRRRRRRACHDDGRALRGATTRSSPSTVAARSTRHCELGVATHGVTPSTADPVAAVLELTDGRGADYGFDAAGVPGTLDQVMAGDPAGRDVRRRSAVVEAVEVTLDRHHRAAARARAHGHLRRLDPSASAPPEFVDLFMAGSPRPRRDPRPPYTLDEAPQALDDLHHGRMTRRRDRGRS